MINEIGLIGKGFVGSCLYEYFKIIPYYCKEGGSFEEVDKKKFIFMCLPTPYKDGFDLSIIEENIERLSDGKVIILKSTILPGTTKALAKKYPQHRFLFNPEFLIEKTAYESFVTPDRQLIGITDAKDLDVATDLLGVLPKSANSAIIDSSEAEMVKLVSNDFLAMKVVFANEIYDYCQSKGVDYEVVSKFVGADHRIGSSHWKIFFDGYRGYGGHCFPKDMKASIYDSSSRLLRAIDDINELIKKNES